MSQLFKGILGAIAIALTFGAVQFASGRDLSARQQSGTPESSINRAAKADRAARVAGPMVRTQTISLRLDGFSATSFLIPVPLAQVARNNAAAPLADKVGGTEPTLACEPVVSVLTEIAKRLQPSRCIT